MGRHTGLMVPLFSAPSTRSWGLGELPDIVPLARWMKTAGLDRLMLLPLGAMPDGETSPYSAISAMAIDPIHIALDDVDDFRRAGGIDALSPEARTSLDAARAASTVEYAHVRRAKREALEIAFARFVRDDWEQLSLRASALAAFIARERWWLDDYSLSRAVVEATGQPAWRDWQPALRDREPAALDEARRRLSRETLRQQYWQWLAETQWQAARAGARAYAVTVLGDLPFVVGTDSADVWARQREFMFDASLGVPPDAFSETGQDWKLPVYRWDVIAAGDFAWIRQRARRMAALFDGYRVDHLVGLYRTFGRPLAGGAPFFSPAHEPDQTRQGEQVLRILVASGALIIAEDLGLVPDFVRASLARLGVPGCKVLRWERAWHDPGEPFIDPRRYPAASAAMTGTHDTEPLAVWWERADRDERAAFVGLPMLRAAGIDNPDAPWGDGLRDAVLAMMLQSGSDELLFPVQDLFGWRDRINTPGTIGDHNWTWRLPWAVERLMDVPEVVERAEFVSERAHRR
jgi:4-alpha-glucanotransferase